MLGTIILFVTIIIESEIKLIWNEISFASNEIVRPTSSQVLVKAVIH